MKLPNLNDNVKLSLILFSLVVIPLIIILLVRILVKENFTSNKPYKELLFFTLDGCQHCENMKPVWNLLKKNYGKNEFIKLIELNAQKDKKLVELYNVTGYPTLLYVKDQKLQKEYNGDRSYEDLVLFLKHSMSN